MEDRLEKLATPKKEKLIIALIDEFSTHGYEKGSTNTIAKKAGISKGSLFNYLGSKKEQFLYILSHTMQFFYVKLGQYMAEEELPEDYFEKLMVRSRVKIRLSLEYPKEYKLIFDTYMNPPIEIKSIIEEKFSFFSSEAIKLEKQMLDASLLKNPADHDKVVELIYYFIAGYSETYLREHRAITASDAVDAVRIISKELEAFFELLRKGYFE